MVRTKVLINFLKEHNCLQQFKENFFKERPEEDFADLVHFNAYNIFIVSFCWQETPEGREYWRNLNYEWTDFLSTNQLY